MADEKLFTLEIISPERIFYAEKIQFVEFTTSEGEVGVYKGHVPMTNVLMPGVVTIHESGEVKKAAVMSGFVVILRDKIKIMAEVAEWPDEIDLKRAEEAKIRAERMLKEGGPGVDMMRAETALKKSIIRIGLKN